MGLKLWTRIAIVNLMIVALLGLTMRAKLMFSMPFLNFKNILHAHSHFAFGGWVTLALLALMTWQLLPAERSSRPVYKWLMGGILVNAAGMLFSFPFQGYAFFSIFFSTLFIFVTYGYTYIFLKDLRRASISRPVKLLASGAVIYMALSSVGAFTLAYLLASKSTNVFLYKDAVYTYLHLQYSGFFTMAVFALLFHKLKLDSMQAGWFAGTLHVSVIPSLFISYLWHNPSLIFQVIALVGALLIVLATVFFLVTLGRALPQFKALRPTVKGLLTIAMVSFLFKMIFQALTIVPSLGPMVFTNRPVIIGFLHLVLLAFITVYLLAHFIHSGLLELNGFSGFAIWLFLVGVIANELVLFTQGLGFMLMMTSAMTNWILLGAAGCLFAGALLLAVGQFASGTALRVSRISHQGFQSFSES